MAGILAALQKNDASISAVRGTDAQSVLNHLEHFRGKDSPPFLEITRYPDLLWLILQLLHERMQLTKSRLISSSEAYFYFKYASYPWVVWLAGF